MEAKKLLTASSCPEDRSLDYARDDIGLTGMTDDATAPFDETLYLELLRTYIN